MKTPEHNHNGRRDLLMLAWTSLVGLLYGRMVLKTKAPDLWRRLVVIRGKETRLHPDPQTTPTPPTP